jgi:hypothetical protein
LVSMLAGDSSAVNVDSMSLEHCVPGLLHWIVWMPILGGCSGLWNLPSAGAAMSSRIRSSARWSSEMGSRSAKAGTSATARPTPR